LKSIFIRTPFRAQTLLLPAILLVCVSAQASEAFRIWGDPLPVSPELERIIQVDLPAEHRGAEPLRIYCAVGPEARYASDKLSLTIFDAGGNVLKSGTATLEGEEGRRRCEFHVAVDALPFGEHRLRFEVGNVLDQPPAVREFTLLKYSHAYLLERSEKQAADVVRLRAHLLATRDGVAARPYAVMRLAIAEEALVLARAALASDDWRPAVRATAYVEEALDAVPARVALAPSMPEFADAGLSPSGTLRTQDGAFAVENRLVYPVGLRIESDGEERLSRLRDYGFNLALVEAESGQTADALRSVAESAQRAGLAVFVSAGSPQPVKDATIPVNAKANFGDPAVQAAHEAELAVLEDLVKSVPGVSAVIVAEKPAFHFGGADVRGAFQRHLRELYLDRYALNDAWRTRFRDISEVDVWLEEDRPAYAYDWQIFHQYLVADYLAGLHTRIEQTGSEALRFAAVADDAFDSGAARLGIGHESLNAFTDVSGCAVACGPDPSPYALDYLPQAMMYVLLKSLAPGKPVFNTEHRVAAPASHSSDHAFRYSHSALWEAAMFGLGGAALGGWEEVNPAAASHTQLVARPHCLEGYSTAALDLNRLIDVVQAFQQAPSEVAILWSLSSKILNDGGDYLRSTKSAFEGVTSAGQQVRFISEEQCASGELSTVRILVIPDARAIRRDAFMAIQAYVADGGIVIRKGVPLQVDPWGHPRSEIIGGTTWTVLIRGSARSTNYLRAMDAAFALDQFNPAPYAINHFGYPLEGVHTRYVEHNGSAYLYVNNLRPDVVTCEISSGPLRGRDLIAGRDVQFPSQLTPLDPMLIRIDDSEQDRPSVAAADAMDEHPALPKEPAVVVLD
jgi:hypothetical protein